MAYEYKEEIENHIICAPVYVYDEVNEGFKIKTKQYINVSTNVIYKELIISWED